MEAKARTERRLEVPIRTALVRSTSIRRHDDAFLIGKTLESQRFGQLGIGHPHPPKSLWVERFPIHTVLHIRWLKKYYKKNRGSHPGGEEKAVAVTVSSCIPAAPIPMSAQHDAGCPRRTRKGVPTAESP